MVSRLSRVPTPLGGLALGIASLGGAWSLIMPDQSQGLKLTAAIIAAILVLKVVLKFILHPHLIREDLSHPVVSSVMPTCAMAIMVIASALMPISEFAARALWVAAVVTHLILLVGFITHRARDFDIEHMVPSWFVPPVGIIVAAVTSPGMGFEPLVNILFVFGLFCYFVKLPIMLYRLIFKSTIPDAALPTFAIMGAPASLSLAGYLTITDNPSLIMISILAPLAIFMTAMVYMAFIKLLRLPFSPGYAAFTFPMVIGATALLKLEGKVDGVFADLFHQLGRIELWVATAIVTYVAIRYIVFYLKPRPKMA
ncbi:C4-dicarboxylate ABC transporter [Endozoicomonas numazuensis]|uniref:C4-dicarboxylate ABC transporter n=1 Tax=Endozoicomonas numazuensis TaxID=1137799 RepID=A0A081MZZ3_9GAMM|nr:C4-dicarboxylate ABC transporter [Endozoicomonas numazuensis]